MSLSLWLVISCQNLFCLLVPGSYSLFSYILLLYSKSLQSLFPFRFLISTIYISLRNNFQLASGSRHMVTCHRLRKPCGTQVCYLHTSVLFTRTPVSTFSAYCSSKTIGAIPAKFIYVSQLIHTTAQTKFERNSPYYASYTCLKSSRVYLHFSSKSFLHQMHLPINASTFKRNLAPY